MFTVRSRFRRVVIATLVVALPLQYAAPAFAAAGATAGAKSGAALISRAQGLYAQARYGEATTLLTGPVNRGELSGASLRDARILLARCYVQTGNTARAKEYFGAVLADDPSFVLDKSKAGQDEIDVFNEVKAANGAAAGSSSAGAGKLPTHQPTSAELGTGSKGGWLANHKAIAALVVAGAGGIAIAAASGGGGGGSSKSGPAMLPAFPGPPPAR